MIRIHQAKDSIEEFIMRFIGLQWGGYIKNISFENKRSFFLNHLTCRDTEVLRLLIMSVVVVLITSRGGFSQTAGKGDLEIKKEQLVKEIDEIQHELDKTKKSKKVNLNQLAALRKQISTREKLIGNYNSQIREIDNAITSKVRVVRSLDRELDTLRKNYANMIYYAYKHRSAYDKLLFLFSAKDFNDAFRRLKYIKRYNAYRRMQAALIGDTQSDLKKQMETLKSQRKNKKQVLSEQEEQRKKLATEKVNKDKMAKTLSKQEKQLKASIDKKRKEQEKLKKQIADLIKKEIEAAKKKSGASSGIASTASGSLGMTPEAAALSASFASNQGKLPWPVSKGELTGTFGEHEHPVLENVKTKNNGIDIKTAAGAEVRTVFKGKVVSIISNPGYNKAVLIKHGEFFTVYSNLAVVKVKANQEVDTKQIIGSAFTDETGETSVHLEIWKGTSLLNPQNWIIEK
jgi:septal ring factor EnvC (AmiA/AmiB activator)